MISQQKQILRRQIRARLSEIDAAERVKFSSMLSSRLAGWLADRHVASAAALAFVPMASEPNWWTAPEINPLRFAYPRVHDGGVDFYGISCREQLTPGEFGIMEPTADNSRRVMVESAVIALVPGLAFDRDGNRMGRGRGIYDGILARTSPGCFRLGVAFDCQVVASVPVEPHDQRVDGVIMPSGFISCSRPR
ncbi:MAG: 5-formyltetrahydrofolate cyclo-ligase [Chthoniobacterales bacterium]